MSTEADPAQTPLPPVVPPRPSARPWAPRTAAGAPPIPTGPPPASRAPAPRTPLPPPSPPGPGASAAASGASGARPGADAADAAAAGGDGEGRRGRGPVRTAAAVLCLVLGFGLLGGAAAGTWLTDGSEADPGAGFARARSLWHEIPVDTLFPRTVEGGGAGPGGADRHWIRVGVAPDDDCTGAFDPALAAVLAPVGCARLLRATYVDETSSSVTTVGMLFTEADERAMRALRERFDRDGLHRRTDLMPRPYAVRGTAAARFGDAQRASWTVRLLTDVPVVVYAVSGFADGRTVSGPQAADEAVVEGQTAAPAQAGLGHDARGIADRVERGLRRTAAEEAEQDR